MKLTSDYKWAVIYDAGGCIIPQGVFISDCMATVYAETMNEYRDNNMQTVPNPETSQDRYRVIPIDTLRLTIEDCFRFDERQDAQ